MAAPKIAFAVADSFFALVQRGKVADERPVAVIQGGRVMDGTPDLLARGGAVGIKRSNLVDMYPEARVVEHRPDDYQAAWERLLDLYAERVPAVEPLDPPFAFLDVAGLDGGVFGAIGREVRSRMGMAVGFGLGATKLLARAAAFNWVNRKGPGPCDGQTTLVSDIDRLPIACLYPMSPKVISQLQRLGVTTFGGARALPVPELARQFGWPLAREIALTAGGGQAGPVRSGWPLPSLTTGRYFEGGIPDQMSLERALREVGDRLSRTLSQQGLGGEEAALRVRSDAGRRLEATRRFPRAVRGRATLTTTFLDLAGRLLKEWQASDPGGAEPPTELEAEVRRIRPQPAIQTDLALFRGFEPGRARSSGGERGETWGRVGAEARAVDEILEVIRGMTRRFGEQTVWIVSDGGTAASRRESLLRFYDPLRAYGKAY